VKDAVKRICGKWSSQWYSWNHYIVDKVYFLSVLLILFL
jgi:hypothetical protein